MRNMKKRMKTIALAALCGVFALSAAGISAAAYNAEAEETQAELSLFLPETYEQYLPLNDPKDAAMNESYIAIADGSTLYLYDREAGEYSRYVHYGSDGKESSIMKLQFSSDGRLFYSDQNTQLYVYDFLTDGATIQSDVPCSTFLIEGGVLYTAAVAGSTTTLYAIPVGADSVSIANADRVGELPSTETPRMTYADNTLYCAINSVVYTFAKNLSGTSDQKWTSDRKWLAGSSTVITGLTALCYFNGEFYFTTGDGLYVADLGVSGTRLLDGSGFGSGFKALFSYGGNLYAVKDSSVRRIEATDQTASYTGYEIATASDLVNRESNAGETVRGGSLLVTADCGNNRLLVYELSAKRYSVIPLEGTPSCVATDGEYIAAGVSNTVYVFRYGETEPYATQTTSIGTTITGVTCIFGNVYYVTDHSYGVVGEEVNEVTRTNSPSALTSDVWGNLYVADVQYRITKFTEEEFTSASSGGTVVTTAWSLRSDYRSLRADFEGNLYYLSGSTLYCNGAQLAVLNADGLVYGEVSAPVSFALGFEDGTVYFQYGSFAASAVLSFPTLSTIASCAPEEVFSSPAPSDVTLVDVRKNATSIRIALGQLTEESEYFAYESHVRTQGGRGILLARTEEYAIVALYGNYGYTVGLYQTDDYTELELTVQELSSQTLYTSNEIPLSYYPCLSSPLTCVTLPRGAQVTALSSVEGGGFVFAYVSYSSGEGTLNGYIPLAYLVETSPVTPEPEVYRIGYLKANAEGVLFLGENGEELTVTDRVQVKIYDSEEGYTVQLTGNGVYGENGVTYTAHVTGDKLTTSDSDVLRTSLIVLLCVIAVSIVVGYVLLVPNRKKK